MREMSMAGYVIAAATNGAAIGKTRLPEVIEGVGRDRFGRPVRAFAKVSQILAVAQERRRFSRRLARLSTKRTVW